MKNLLNKLLFLLTSCIIVIAINIIFSLVQKRPLLGFDFYSALVYGVVLWLYYLISGKLENWMFRKKDKDL